MTDPHTPPPSDAPADRLDADQMHSILVRRALATGDEWYSQIAEVKTPGGLTRKAIVTHKRGGPPYSLVCQCEMAYDAEFIAHAPADIDYLLDALTEARSACAAAEHRYADLAETINGSSERVSNAMMQLNVYYVRHDYDDYWNLMEHLRLLRDDLTTDIASSWDGDGSDSAGGSGAE